MFDIWLIGLEEPCYTIDCKKTMLYELRTVNRLFTSVDESALNASTFTSLRVLLSNFNPVLGQDDPELTTEINNFLADLIGTEVISILHGCLVDWGKYFHIRSEQYF